MGTGMGRAGSRCTRLACMGAVVVTVVAAIAAGSANAAQLIWAGDKSGEWTATGLSNNWFDVATGRRSLVLPGSSDDVLFSLSSPTYNTINPPGGANVPFHSFSFVDTANRPIVLSLGGTLRLTSSGTALSVSSGTVRHIIRTPLMLGANQTWDVAAPAGAVDANLLTIESVISQSSGATYQLTKTGGGTLLLSNGSNSYGGGTIVAGGTLMLTNTGVTSATGNGAVSVQSNGTLAGTGRAKGTVLLAGTIAPSMGTGYLRTGAQTWSDGAAYRWEVRNAAGTAGQDWGLLSVAGAMSLDDSAHYTIRLVSLTSGGTPGAAAGFDPSTQHEWLIASATSISQFNAASFAVDSSAFANALDGGRFTVTTNAAATQLLLHFDDASHAPEPASLAVVALAGLLLLRRRPSRPIR